MLSKSPLVVLMPLLLLLVSCESEPPPATQKGALKTEKIDQLLVVARFLDEETLKLRYGRRHNAFISAPRIATPRRFMVFKLNFEEVSETIIIKRKEMSFQFGGREAGPLSEFAMYDYWEREDDSSEILPADQRRRKATIRDNLLPAEVKIPPGGRISGLAVFSANYPRYGTAILYIPIYDESERLLKRVEITFEF
jgi:hypothetical protein